MILIGKHWNNILVMRPWPGNGGAVYGEYCVGFPLVDEMHLGDYVEMSHNGGKKMYHMDTDRSFKGLRMSYRSLPGLTYVSNHGGIILRPEGVAKQWLEDDLRYWTMLEPILLR